MTSVSKFRIAALAVIVGGAAYAGRAEAAPTEVGPCQDYARGYAAGYCAASGQYWSSVSYTCNADGTANISRVTCTTEVLPPP